MEPVVSALIGLGGVIVGSGMTSFGIIYATRAGIKRDLAARQQAECDRRADRFRPIVTDIMRSLEQIRESLRGGIGEAQTVSTLLIDLRRRYAGLMRAEEDGPALATALETCER